MPAVLLTGLFNALWLLSVAGGNTGALLCLPLQVYLFNLHNHPRQYIILLLSLAGCAFDALLFCLQQLHTQSTPFWLLNVWCLFFILMPDLLRPLYHFRGLLRLSAAISAPLAYYAGSQLGDLSATPLAYIAISIFWAICLPPAMDILYAKSAAPAVVLQSQSTGQ
jgi:hypothetical protein